VLDTPPEPAFDAIVEAASRITGCPIALVSLVDEGRQWFKARIGLEVPETSREVAFCSHAILGEGVFEVPDALSDPRFADNPLVTGHPDIRYYAGAPISLDGQPLGTLCVIDTQPRHLPTPDLSLLAHLADTVCDLLRQHESHRSRTIEHERLADLARASGDWAWECDEELRYTWVAPNVLYSVGLHPEEMMGEQVMGLGRSQEPEQTDQRYHEGLLAEFAHALARKQAASRLIVGAQVPKGYIYLSFSMVPLFGPEGEFRGYRGTARDVTAQIRGLRKAQATDARLRELAAQVPGGLLQVEMRPDYSVYYHFVSDKARELLDKRPPRAGTSAPECVQVHVVLPEDLPPLLAKLAQASAELTQVHAEYRVMRADGSITWVENRGTPQRLENGHLMWHTFLADITQRKQAELTLAESQERLALAAEIMGLGVGRIDLQQGTLTLDTQARRNHGLSTEAESVSMEDYMGTLHPDERGPMQQEIAELVQGAPGMEHRLRVCGPDGKPRLVELVCRPVKNLNGDTTAIIGLSRDVTEAADAERLLREKDDALRATRAKSEFLSRVSHELRTPLNAILGFGQLMEMDGEHPLPPAQAQRLIRLQLAGKRLLDLINDVLDLSRIEGGGPALKPQAVDVGEAIVRCASISQSLALAADVRLRLPESAGLWARADARALEQIILNLMSNAIKYNRKGGEVRIGLELRENDLVLTVSDDGAGIPPEKMSTLFHPFQRLGAESTPIQGSGLGLVISRGLAQAMGGRIDAHSEPGHGSTFTVVLPATEAPEPSRMPDTPFNSSHPQPIPPSGPAGWRSARVLYIEDEPLNVLLLQGMFAQRPQWRLTCVGTLAEGMAEIDRGLNDLVLMDMHLPDGHGLDAIAKIRARPHSHDLRCIALSADAMPEQIERALKAGFDDYWTKPLDLSSLLAELDLLLQFA
jgi:PAS domain S-box-containing protein